MASTIASLKVTGTFPASQWTSCPRSPVSAKWEEVKNIPDKFSWGGLGRIYLLPDRQAEEEFPPIGNSRDVQDEEVRTRQHLGVMVEKPFNLISDETEDLPL
ncbi:hypothetical protein FGLOB1_12958 [Fusarium globosum]|uniref:Uncharacterized protein n=1 Tax=Fusarium globosum TaxID=78864 RepID=A0A8H5XP33_9HYPO|nr:hypothetical protein FGLOB1_12958 [Fusarium globosum]